jgi:hypothetical protein
MYIECTSDIMRMFSEFAKTVYINIYIYKTAVITRLHQ